MTMLSHTSIMNPPLHTTQDAARLFVLNMIRIMATGGINDARATMLAFSQFRQSYRRPLILLRALVLEIARMSHRTILIAPLCCTAVTADETLLLSALGHGEAEFSSCHKDACRVLGREDALAVATCFQAVATCFADLGVPLS